MERIVLIPAYKPDEKLIALVEELEACGLGILVVNDGSGPDYNSIFEVVAKKAEVVSLPCNSGKGYALKSGMTTIMEKHPECKYFVTADSDGQHKSADILRVFSELESGSEFVLTVRKFRKDMPLRSKIGNNLSRYIYTILNSHYFIDNQSGLRGFDARHAEWLVRVGGNKYDYEMNMLYYADKQGVIITTIPIEAIYIDNNSSSHFDPVNDTVRIYKRLFWSARITFASILIIEQMILAISILMGYNFLHITLPTVGATAIAFNVVLNRFVVFRKFRYRDYMRVMVYTIIRFIFYSWGLWVFKLFMPYIPLFVSFNIIAIVMIPAEYLIHKLLYLSKYHDVNKER